MDIYELEPKSVWKHFYTICSIPHPSHHEEALAKAIIAWAQERKLFATSDKAGNVVIRKPASSGMEDSPGVILQAHLDMVPQKATDVSHDFEKDPIRAHIDPANPSWLVATGTTLGADNGIGVAMAMAILEDDNIAHGPLHCLFTVNEEDGMGGARAVEPDLLSGNLLLNLDGEDVGELTIGCAGTIRTGASLSSPASSVPDTVEWFEVTIEGLLGGHSGVDIDKGRANATLALISILSKTRERLYLSDIVGGTAANAIPREARATIGIESGNYAAFKTSFSSGLSALRIALGQKDPGLLGAVTPLGSHSLYPSKALAPEATNSMMTVLSALPNGLVAMETNMPGLIRTSLNLGQLAGSVSDELFELKTMVLVRSSSDAEKESLSTTVEKRLEGAADHGWKVSTRRLSESPAWSPDPSSLLLAEAHKLYREMFGKEPRVTSTHGGLETGLFRARFPAWDMLSLGPTIRHPHSPNERLDIASVRLSYRYLTALLSRL